MVQKMLFTALLILIAQSAMAADHYVSPEGSASWNDSSDIETPCSLATANASVRAGDTVYLRGGEYSSYVSPVGNGRSASERIIYSNYKDEQAKVSGTRYAIHLVRKSYITVKGIDFSNCQQFLIIQAGHFNEIIGCTFDKNKYETTWMGSWVNESSTYNRISGCTFSRFGWVLDGDDKGAVLDIGYDTSTTDATNYNVIENNVFYYGGHHILHICGSFNVVRGNYFHNEEWMDLDKNGGAGNRNAMTIGPMAQRNLFEGNRFAFAGKPPDDNGANGLVIRCPKNIARRNMSYANGAGGIAFASMTVSNPTDNHVYFNTIYHNGYNDKVDHYWQAGLSFGNWGNGTMPGNVIKNNIMYMNRDAKAIGGYGDPGPQTIESNWDEKGDPVFMDATIPTDTSDSSLPDFRLRAGSPCIDSGAFLTKIESESGSGTTFVVEDAGYFYDGWGIEGESGDIVQLEGQTGTAQIVAVDYDANTITVDKSLSWTRGLGLSLEYSGTAPDLGAFEFGNSDVSVQGRKNRPQSPP